MTPDIHRIGALCQSVMRGVASANVITDANIDRAVEIMRAEVKALFFGDEYKPERDALALRTVSEATVLQSMVASCILKITGDAS